ncbi:zinc finger protein 480-like [Papilio machaon]|uniref:zinc finger protein 480-like n=1 Tax=Papilio machaon TaxID=76193 RepID=UPI001E663155|nr:zinc finger protein 480-like [Papilio machaon]
MCEWLSSGEWSDVRLMCGGRSFSAHRAVLASVSSYLREVLLSCPAKDSPAYIILPEFDLDALSSVLYYIYHGEVVIQRRQLNEFLDIIRNLKIYIDPQYLIKISNVMEKSRVDLSYEYQEKYLAMNDDTTCSDANSECEYANANLKKGVESIMYKVQYSLNGFDFGDKQIRTRSEKFSSSAGDVVQCKDRQRGSLLRDLFIETYARNGCSNGLGAGVLAISNERYRGSTSVLFKNANAVHPTTLAETHEIVSELRSYVSPTSNRPLTSHENYEVLKNCTKQSFVKINRSKVDEKVLTEDRREKELWVNSLHLPLNFNNNYSIRSESSTLDLRMSPKSDGVNCLFTRNKFVDSSSIKEFNERIHTKNEINYKSLDLKKITTREVILNEVLESPWIPRLPYYYKPFRRKTVETFPVILAKSHLDVGSDKNNNINEELSSSTIDVTKNDSNSEIKDAAKSRSRRLSARDLKCTACNQVFSSEESFTTHMRRHTSMTRYSCGECYKTFSQLRNFKYHMSVHRGTKEFATTCPVCGKYFNDRGYLSSHMKIHRNRKEYKCSMCPKSFNQRVAYNMHVRIHTGVKPHVCGECGKAFSRKMLLKQHARTHSGERPYACPHCDRRFADRSNMTLHLRLHTGVKPFSCSLCPKSFTKKHHLKSHLNFHTGAKPYSCPRCKLAFTQSSNMRTHLKKCNAPDAILTPEASS